MISFTFFIWKTLCTHTHLYTNSYNFTHYFISLICIYLFTQLLIHSKIFIISMWSKYLFIFFSFISCLHTYDFTHIPYINSSMHSHTSLYTLIQPYTSFHLTHIRIYRLIQLATYAYTQLIIFKILNYFPIKSCNFIFTNISPRVQLIQSIT